jgi:hypothetical protein
MKALHAFSAQNIIKQVLICTSDVMKTDRHKRSSPSRPSFPFCALAVLALVASSRTIPNFKLFSKFYTRFIATSICEMCWGNRSSPSCYATRFLHHLLWLNKIHRDLPREMQLPWHGKAVCITPSVHHYSLKTASSATCSVELWKIK